MSTEENKALVRHLFEEVFNKGNLAAFDEMYVANHVNHFPGNPPGLPSGREGSKQLVTRQIFPCQRPIPDEARGRLVAGKNEQANHGKQFGLAQSVTCFFDLDELAGQIVLDCVYPAAYLLSVKYGCLSCAVAAADGSEQHVSRCHVNKQPGHCECDSVPGGVGGRSHLAGVGRRLDRWCYW